MASTFVAGKIRFLAPPDEIDVINRHERTGRPLGEEGFIEKLEIELDRVLRPQRPGPKKSID
jgi:putative transposase